MTCDLDALQSIVYCDGFFPSALLDDSTGAASEVCLESSDTGVAGRDVPEAADANCHAGILGRAPVTPDPDAAGTLGASNAFAAILISLSPCWTCVVAGAKGELERPAEEAMAEGEAKGLFRAIRSVRSDFSSACSSWSDEACACACLSII